MRWSKWASVCLVMTACGESDRAPAGGAGGAPDAGLGATGGTEGGAGGATEAGPGGSGGSGGSGDLPIDPTLGAPCIDDTDCSSSTFCLTSDSTAIAGGGPPHGMCVADCREGGGDLCQSIDFTATCLIVGGFDTPLDQTDDTSFCVPTCQIGDASNLASKCGGRLDLACSASDVLPRGYCFPSCRNDADCDGRPCDLATGLCFEAPRGTGAIGAPCQSDAECSGFCIGYTPTLGACSGYCTLGSSGCGETSLAGEPLDAACLFGEVSNLSGLGDAGYCAQLCDCNDDCLHPSFICDPVNIQSTGRSGICFPAEQSDGTLLTGIACGGTDGGSPGDASVPLDGAPAADASTETDASTPDAEGPTAPEASTDARSD